MPAGVDQDLVTFLGVDESDVVKGVASANKELEKFSKRAAISARKASQSMSRFGRNLTLFVTAPIVALGVSMTKVASDAEETAQKFNVVFSGVAKEANAAAKSIASGFGLAQDESQRLLGNTGDLLTGFGFTQQAALELSIQTNQLAADLASFTNVEGGAARASKALTSALLGERESVKSLGISILEVDVLARVLTNTQSGLTFETIRQAKAYATLQIATDQSKNAIGDFQRSINSTANQARIFTANLRDIRVEMGTRLLPIANIFLKFSMDMAASFKSLSNETKTSIIEIAALTAAIGPVLFIGGKFLAVILALGPALTFVFNLSVAVFSGIAAAVSVPVLAIGVLGGLFVAMLNDMGLLVPAVDLFKAAWNGLGNIFKSVGDFAGKFFDFIKGGTVELTNGQTIAMDIIGKGWLIVKGVWLGLRVAFQSMVIGILVAQSALLKGAEKTFAFFGVDFAADAIAGYNMFVVEAIKDLDTLTDANVDAIALIAESWSTGAEVLQKDAASILGTFTALAEGTKALIGENTPEFINVIRERIAELRAALAGLGGGGGGALPSATGAVTKKEEPEAGVGGFFANFDAALIANIESIENWGQFAVNAIDTVAQGFTDGFKAIISGEKGFGKSLIGIMNTVSTQLLDIAFKSIFQRIAMKFVETKANAAAAAPTPFMIPLFVGLAVASFGAILGGSGFEGAGSGGGGGGGGAAPAPPTAVASVIEAPDVPDDVAGGGVREVIIINDFEDILYAGQIKRARDGFRPDGVHALGTVS